MLPRRQKMSLSAKKGGDRQSRLVPLSPDSHLLKVLCGNPANAENHTAAIGLARRFWLEDAMALGMPSQMAPVHPTRSQS